MDIQADVLRFCKSHNWYRYLPWHGKEYLIFPWKGQQPKSTLDLKVEDSVNLHWWFWDADFIEEIPINGIGKDIIMRRPIRFNCFLRGFDGEGENKYFAGVGVIRVKSPEVEEDLRQKYESHKKKDISFLANMEHLDQVRNAVNIGFQICELFKTKCPEWLGINSPGLPRTLTLPANIGISSKSNREYKRYPSPPPIKKAKSESIVKKTSHAIPHLNLTSLDRNMIVLLRKREDEV